MRTAAASSITICLIFCVCAFRPAAGAAAVAKPAHASIERASGAVVPPVAGHRSVEAEILQYINEYRATIGLRPLEANDLESALAQRHSQDMAKGRTGFGHGGFNERAKAIRKSMTAVSAVAENVAEGPMTPREVVDGWLHSPPHKQNIEGDYTLTGIGTAIDKKGRTWFTQLFSR